MGKEGDADVVRLMFEIREALLTAVWAMTPEQASSSKYSHARYSKSLSQLTRRRNSFSKPWTVSRWPTQLIRLIQTAPSDSLKVLSRVFENTATLYTLIESWEDQQTLDHLKRDLVDYEFAFISPVSADSVNTWLRSYLLEMMEGPKFLDKCATDFVIKFKINRRFDAHNNSYSLFPKFLYGYLMRRSGEGDRVALIHAVVAVELSFVDLVLAGVNQDDVVLMDERIANYTQRVNHLILHFASDDKYSIETRTLVSDLLSLLHSITHSISRSATHQFFVSQNTFQDYFECIAAHAYVYYCQENVARVAREFGVARRWGEEVSAVAESIFFATVDNVSRMAFFFRSRLQHSQ
jgi:hypothetical protein